MSKEKRKDMRIQILNGTVEYYVRGGTYERGRLHDLSAGGAFIGREIPMDPKSEIVLMFRLPSDLGILECPAEVIWVRWGKTKKSEQPLGFSVKFHLDKNRQKIMDSFLIYMRNIQIIDVSKRIIEQFYGPGEKPPVFPPKG